jgi:hypothetical protein
VLYHLRHTVSSKGWEISEITFEDMLLDTGKESVERGLRIDTMVNLH